MFTQALTIASTGDGEVSQDLGEVLRRCWSASRCSSSLISSILDGRDRVKDLALVWG
jgi:hypothetical protein